MPPKTLQVKGLGHTSARHAADDLAQRNRQRTEETLDHVRPPVLIQPAARDQQPVQVILNQAGQGIAIPFLLCSEARKNPAIGNIVQILCNEFRIRYFFTIRDEKWQLSLGCLAGVRNIGQRKFQVERLQQHFYLQAERADIAHAKGGGKGDEFQHRDSLLYVVDLAR